MPPDPSRCFRRRVTIRHLGTLVAFAAVASAVVMPQLRGTVHPWGLAFVSAVELPYALLIPALVLIRTGPLKSWPVALLCAIPLAAFAIILGLRVNETLLGTWLLYTPLSALGVVFVVACTAMVILALATLARWLIPRSCPTCRRLAMLRDASVPRARRFTWRSEPRTCLACGSRFRRDRGGPWVDVDGMVGSG